MDCTQSVEAQTVANCFAAIDNGLDVIPVLNKIDLPAADPEKVILDIEEIIGIDARNALLVSAKTGEGLEELFGAIIERVPPPQGNIDAPLTALIIDSWFDITWVSFPGTRQ